MKDLLSIPEYDLILVDAMNMAYRHHYAMQGLQYNDKPTGMLFGIARYILKLRHLYNKAQIIFLWEGTQSRRKGMFSGYKSSRRKPETKFQEALAQIPLFLENAGVDQMYHIGLEADDAAGYLVSKNEDKRILLVTTDEDWFQFMNPNVSIQRRDSISTYEDLKVLFGYPPEKAYLIKILRGKHDDLPGVKGLPGTVINHLIAHCDNLKDILEYPFTNKSQKWKKAIQEEYREVIERNAELTLYHPEWINEDQIMRTVGMYNPDKLIEIIDEYGLKSLVKEVTR